MATRTAASAQRRHPNATTVDPDDALMMRAAELAAWAKKNARLVITAAVLLFATVGGYLYYRLWQAGRAERAATQFLQVAQSVVTGDTAQGKQQLRNFINSYDGTQEADEARLMLGEMHLRANQPKQALPVLREVAGDGGSPLQFQGKMLLGAALSADGNREGALQSYLDAAGEADLAFQRQEALNEAALLREQAGDWTGAAELYRRMVEDTEEGSLDRSIIEMRLTEAEARGSQRGAAAPAAQGGKQ